MKSVFIAVFLTAVTASSNQGFGFEANSSWQKKFVTFIVANPKVPLTVAVAEANKILQQEGLNTHVFFKSAATWNVTKQGGWTLRPPTKPNPCDQRIGSISAVQAQGKSVILAKKNRSLKVELPTGARLAKVEMTNHDSK